MASIEPYGPCKELSIKESVAEHLWEKATPSEREKIIHRMKYSMVHQLAEALMQELEFHSEYNMYHHTREVIATVYFKTGQPRHDRLDAV